MIKSLHITNYALIEELDIDFHKGLNIITGETGAGKSIILGALSLLLGGRADTKVIGDSGKKSVIEAIFTLDADSELKGFFAEKDIDWDDTGCVLRREILPSGRSRAFINDSPVNLDLLREVAVQLVDIHSQHQNLLLASPPYQMRIIDVLAGNSLRLKEYAGKFARYKDAVREYALMRRSIEKADADEEYMRYQLSKIDEVSPVDGEQESLEQERDLLANVSDVKETLAGIVADLTDDTPSALSLLKDASVKAGELTSVMEEGESLVERLETLRVELQDIAETFQDFDSDLNANPSELEEIEARLDRIYDLYRRFHVETIAEILDIRRNLVERLGKIDNADVLLSDLEAKARSAKKECVMLAREISAARKEEAGKFENILRERAMPLGMKNLVVRVDVTQADLSATGMDDVEFFFAFNKNQEPLPVGKTASGGEISRLMLAIKSIVADKMELPSIIFDEVDTGVSGEIANRMGELMKQISGDIQVITITHLPQVAAKGDAHYKVFKQDTDTRTTTRIGMLDKNGRINELALMLGGSNNSEAARANAISLLENN